MYLGLIENTVESLIVQVLKYQRDNQVKIDLHQELLHKMKKLLTMQPQLHISWILVFWKMYWKEKTEITRFNSTWLFTLGSAQVSFF